MPNFGALTSINYHLKHILTFVLLVAFLQAFSQTPKPQPIKFSKTFYFDSQPKVELYTKAKQWFASQYEDPSSIFIIDNEEGGTLIGNANLGYSDPRIDYGVEYNSLNGIISYTITLNVRNGEIEFMISDFRHRAFPYGSKGTRNSFGLITTANTFEGKLYGYNASEQKVAWDRIKFSIDDFANKLIKALSEYVSQKKENQ